MDQPRDVAVIVGSLRKASIIAWWPMRWLNWRQPD